MLHTLLRHVGDLAAAAVLILVAAAILAAIVGLVHQLIDYGSAHVYWKPSAPGLSRDRRALDSNVFDIRARRTTRGRF